MSSQNNIRAVMHAHTLVPVVTFATLDHVDDFVAFLKKLDVHCIEITLRTPEGIKAIEYINKAYGAEMLTGAGTVINERQIKALKGVGTDFIVSPGLTPKLAEGLEKSGIPFLPGISTPSEIMQAKEFGFDTLKFFPANLFGGLKGLKAYGSVFPDIQFCPTGGVTKDTCNDYLNLPNVMAVGGSWFQKDFEAE